MKDGKTSVSLNLNLMTEKTKFEKMEEKLKLSIFGVLYVLLKNQDVSIWVEIIFIILQLLQFLAFPFNGMFINVWKKNDSFSQVSSFLQYFQIVVFFQDNTEMYIIAFYICIILLILVIINIIYVSVSFSKNRFGVVWPLRVLRSVMSFLVSVLFLPIFQLFVSIFSCVDSSTVASISTTNSTTAADNTSSLLRYLVNSTNMTSNNSTANSSNQTGLTGTLVNSYAPGITCWSGAHYVHVIFAIVISVAFIIICLLVQITYFETKSSTHNPTAKSSSKSDVFMLICKIITVILFGFVQENDWVLIVIIFFLSGYLLFIYYESRPYYNGKMMKMYLSVTAIYFWSTLVLVIGKILVTTSFDGALPLFFIGIPIILLIILTNYDDKLSVLLTNINKFQKGEKVQNQIRYFLELVDKKDYDRNSKVLLKGYIFLYEETCTFPNCALKKYIASLENKVDAVVFLLQHAESLYQNAISKFPNCTSLRISYAFFLLERLNKKQQANLELLNTEKYSPKFEEQFIIYRYKKIIEEQSTEVNDNEENLDVVSNIAYKNHFNLFKNSISKVSTLYMDFWSLLLNPNQDNQEDLTKLNDYGSKINTLVEEINSHFEKMQKLKHNDQEVIRYYSDFLYDILNDKEKALQYKTRLNEMEGSKQTYDEVNILNVDINALASSDEYQYIVISAQPEKFGIITNISLGVCSLFGYTRSELVGKLYEVIMPEIYHKGHRMILQEKLNDFKKQSVDISSSKNYKPSFKDISAYGRNKSRYLVPISFKSALLPNENNDTVFIAKIWQDMYNINSSQNQQTCFILTNNFLIIQNFTANAVNLLGMGSSAINGTLEITGFIKQFHEEFHKCVVEFEENTQEQRMKIKRDILSKRFRTPVPILWKKNEMNPEAKMKSTRMMELQNSIGFENEAKMTSSLKETVTKLKPNNAFVLKAEKTNTEENLILTVSEATINGKQEGYVFKFETMFDSTKSQGENSMKEVNMNIQTIKETLFHDMDDENKLETVKETNKEDATGIFESLDAKKTPTTHIGPTVPVHKKQSKVISNDVSSFTIDKTFLPEKSATFHLDPKKMSYMVNPKNPEELKACIKEEAFKKMKLNRDPTAKSDQEATEEEESDSNANDSNEYESDSSISRSESESVRVKEVPKKKQNEDGYFQVTMDKIKFYIYDYSKGTPNEVKDYQKISQVDLKMNEDLRKKEDEQISPEQKGVEKNLVEKGEEESVDNHGKEGILIKQIEYALSKEETQPTITRMKWISFFIFLGVLGIAGVFLGMFLNSLMYLGENVLLIENSYDLVMNTIYGVYHTRELTLLANPKYTNIFQDRSVYITNNTNTILDLFTSSHDLLTNIITTFLPISAANDEYLANSTIYTTILEDDFSIKQFNLTLSSSFIETNTALYHVGHTDLSSVLPTNKDVFFFLYNSLNDISDALNKQASIFIEELSLNIGSNKILFLLIFLAAAVFLIISYCLISFAYSAVAKRKESYLEVFFEIGNSVIKTSLEKCEKFSKKIQADSLSEMISNVDENEINEDTTVNLTKESGKKASGGKKRKTNNSRETRIIKFKVVLGLSGIGLFFLLVFLFYQSYMNTLEIYMDIYKNQSLEQREYLMLFNSLREYFFDPTTSVLRYPLTVYIANVLDSMYTFKLDKADSSAKNKDYFPSDYSDLFNKIYHDNICSYAGDLFDAYMEKLNINCTTFVSNSTSYGLNILLTHYIEESRYLKYLNDLFTSNSKTLNSSFTYNNTLFGTDKGNAFIPKETSLQALYKSSDPFIIFTTNTHRDISVLNRYIIRPAFQALVDQLKQSIDYSIQFTQTIYISIFSIFLAGAIVLYLFLWRPFESGLNQTIYKTKNMLSIIPKEVLASLGNIHKLLDIGQNFSKHGKRLTKTT